MKTHYWETRQSMTAQKALQFLKEGNQRFLKNLRVNRNILQLVNETAERQFPFATVLSCSDSRVPVELVFDQGLGDIFSIRLAGNIASNEAIGSMEFACKALGSKLILVMGHTGCGAIKGACDDFKMDNLTRLLEQIKPSVDAETATASDRNSSNRMFVDNVTKLNIEHQIEMILDTSKIISELAEKNEIIIVGAIYEVETGRVNFFDEIKSIKENEKSEVYEG